MKTLLIILTLLVFAGMHVALACFSSSSGFHAILAAFQIIAIVGLLLTINQKKND